MTQQAKMSPSKLRDAVAVGRPELLPELDSLIEQYEDVMGNWHDCKEAHRGLLEQYEGIQAEWRDYKATTEDVISGLEEQLEALVREKQDWLTKGFLGPEDARRLQEQYESLKHIVECADTPLMRDVLAERDGLKEQFDALHETLLSLAEGRVDFDQWRTVYLAAKEQASNPASRLD